MSQGIPYSASQQDLYFPAKSLDSFPTVRPRSDEELCAWLALLAYCDQYPNFAFDQNKISGKLAPLGFRVLAFPESQGHPNNGGTHCFVAFYDDPVPANKLAVVAFRGTDKDDPTDVLDDVEAQFTDWPPGGRVFDGFSDAYDEVKRQLEPVLQTIDCRVLFTGHSLGAALATLLTSIRAPDALYTIGSPRVGDHDFVATLSGVKNFRYVDCCDAVAQLPPPFLGFGYAHLGDPLYIDRNRKVISNPDDGYILADRLRASADYALQYMWKSGNVGSRALADHAPINYVTAIAAAASA